MHTFSKPLSRRQDDNLVPFFANVAFGDALAILRTTAVTSEPIDIFGIVLDPGSRVVGENGGRVVRRCHEKRHSGYTGSRTARKNAIIRGKSFHGEAVLDCQCLPLAMAHNSTPKTPVLALEPRIDEQDSWCRSLGRSADQPVERCARNAAQELAGFDDKIRSAECVRLPYGARGMTFFAWNSADDGRSPEAADPAKAFVMAEIARLVEDGSASIVTLNSGGVELHLAAGEAFRLGHKTVTRVG